MLCVYSAELDAVAADGATASFSGAEVQRYARRELMPDELFELLLDRPDHQLDRRGGVRRVRWMRLLVVRCESLL